MSTVRSMARRPSSTPMSAAPSCCSRQRVSIGRGYPIPESALPVSSRLDRRSFRLARRGGLFSRDEPLSAQLALLRLQSRFRSFGARLAPDLWTAHGLLELLEQLRALSFPRKADPAHDPKRARRQEISVYGDGGNIRDWLYVEDHARALVAIAERGAAGETL